MIKIRTNVFETNSSSSHSITIPYPLQLEENKMEINDAGYIEVSLSEFCYQTHTSQMDRLAWLIQLLINEKINHNAFWGAHYRGNWDELAEQLYKLEEFQELESRIADYASCKGIRLVQGTEGYIDHESCYESMNSFLFDYYNIDSVSFVFGKDIKMMFAFD